MNSELTPREHAEMRDTILAGAQRLHSTAQRRMQVIAASVAFVLVAGLSGGAIATAAFVGANNDRIAVTPTETPEPSVTLTRTPTPTPEPTPTTPVAPAEGVVAFDGDCARVLSEDEVSAAFGQEMTPLENDWDVGAPQVLGGVECRWAHEHRSPYFAVAVYPESVVPSEFARDQSAEVCRPGEGASVCNVTGSVGGTWFSLTTAEEHRSVLGPLAEAVARNVAAVPSPSPPAPSATWWTLPACDRLSELDIPGLLGSEGAAVLMPNEYPPRADRSEGLPEFAGRDELCSWHYADYDSVSVRVTPGAGRAFPHIAASASAQPVAVDGATQAVVVIDTTRALSSRLSLRRTARTSSSSTAPGTWAWSLKTQSASLRSPPPCWNASLHPDAGRGIRSP